MKSIEPKIYEKRYPSGTPYYLVKCQVPDMQSFGTSKTYQKKHSTRSDAEFDRVRIIREFGGGSASFDLLRDVEAAEHRLRNCTGPARGKSLTFAIDWFVANYRSEDVSPSLAEAVEHFRTRHLVKCRADTVEEYERYLPKLVERLGATPVGNVSSQMLQEHFTICGPTKHHRKCLVGLFSFCSGGSKRIRSPYNWLVINPAKFLHIDTDEEKDNEIMILTLDEVKAALAMALFLGDLPFWVWSIFTGMRPCETKKFWTLPGYGWERVNLDAGVITVNTEISKVHKRRKIVIRPILRRWLEYFRSTGEPMYPAGHRLKFRAVKVAAIDPHHHVRDILRHTFISFRAHAFDRSFATTCVEAGNSEGIIKDHYYDLITDEKAVEQYWNLGPEAFGLGTEAAGMLLSFEAIGA